ncbi:alpha-L-fucosidase, partial [bacterium]|nr:alpha-L-fucosidase [bacterium]
MPKLGICLALLALFLCSSLINPSLADTADAKAERLAWWTEARFGMFIHWGLYA